MTIEEQAAQWDALLRAFLNARLRWEVSNRAEELHEESPPAAPRYPTPLEYLNLNVAREQHAVKAKQLKADGDACWIALWEAYRACEAAKIPKGEDFTAGGYVVRLGFTTPRDSQVQRVAE